MSCKQCFVLFHITEYWLDVYGLSGRYCRLIYLSACPNIWKLRDDRSSLFLSTICVLIQYFFIHTANHFPLSSGIPLNNNTFKTKLETHLLKIIRLKNSQFSSFFLHFLVCQKRTTADKMLEHLLADFPKRMTQFVQKWQVPQFIL